MSEKKSKKLVPQLRFKGFTDPWEQRKAKDIFTPRSEKGRADLPVLSATQTNGIVYRNNVGIDIKFDERALDTYKVVHPGDFLISLRSFQGGFEYSDKLGISSPAYTVFFFREDDNQSSSFWKILFKTASFVESLKKVTFGIRDGKAISFRDFQSLKVSYPNQHEQTQIGGFFSVLDSLIAAHERKLELLKKKKNYYLQQIFSQKIRLKGFNDPWKQRKLLSCVEKILDFRGRTPKKLGLKWSTSGSLALSALNVKQGYIDKEVPTYHGDCQLYKRWMGDSTLHKGQVVFTTEAPMGNVAQIPDNEKYILSQRTIAFELSAKILQDSFLALLLISPEVRKMLMQKTSGATAQGISQKTLAELVLSIPNLTEQNYVSSFFQVLNELIYMEQRKQTLLKQQKQAYLQKMFV